MEARNHHHLGRAPHRCLMLLVLWALGLSGCCGVYTTYPLRRDLSEEDLKNVPVGIWRVEGGFNLEARIMPDGHAWLATTGWDGENHQFTFHTTEAWVTPREGAGNGGYDGYSGYLSIRQMTEEGKPIDRWGLLAYTYKDATLIVHNPDTTAFGGAIENGDLEGSVYTNTDDSPVLVTTSADRLWRFVTTVRDDAGWVESYQNLFRKDETHRLPRIGGCGSTPKPEENLGSTPLLMGGADTLKDPPAPVQVSGVSVVECGLVGFAKERCAPATGPAGINILPEERPTLITATTRIPAIVGRNFGVRFIVEGTPSEASAYVTTVWRFPQPGLLDPARKHPWFEHRSTEWRALGKEEVVGYALRFDWELVPGTWTVELWKGNRRLLVQQFELVRPDAISSVAP